MITRSASTKAINPEKERQRWERRAKPVFRNVYNGQMSRIANAIRRASPETLQQFLREQWILEPDIVKQAVILFYDDIARISGTAAINSYDLVVDWDIVNDALFQLSNQRAGLFANAMTQTSMRQSQTIIRDWLQTDGATVGQLQDRMKGVWTGPRPDAAATTETTFMVSESKVTAWEQSEVWGYNVNTMEDAAVRASHEEVSNNGPYPLADTQHRPPIFGDVNCRCFVSPRRENPDAS